MRLYHGTSYSALRRIAHEGVVPRGDRESTFQKTAPSNPNAVYLTDTYPVYFAAVSANGGIGAVIEIETNLLDEDRFNADEDVLEQTRTIPTPRGASLVERVIYCRDRLNEERFDYRESLRKMGTCTYFGVIPPEAITRVAVVDFAQQAALHLAACDASINVFNFAFCALQHRQLTAWLFGDAIQEPSGDDFQSALAKAEREIGIVPWYEREDINIKGIKVIPGDQLVAHVGRASSV
jgi:Dynein, heavy chain